MSTINSRAQHRPAALGTKTMVSMAMLCALAYLVMYLSKTIFAPLTVAGFLTFDLKDVVIAIGGFLFGPLHAFAISLTVSFIEMVTISKTGPVGMLMNVLSTIAFVCPAAYWYKKKRSMSSAVFGLVAGAVLMTAIMLFWNYLITPLYQNVPREVIAGMLVPVFLPFNVLKASMNAALTILLYKPIVLALRKAGLVPERASGGKGGARIGSMVVTVIVLATVLLFAMVLAGKI